MSRARDMANLGAQAGSGFDASDLTTGTLSITQFRTTLLGWVLLLLVRLKERLGVNNFSCWWH